MGKKEGFNPETDKRGIHNWRNLFRKPTVTDWIIFAVLILTLVNSYTYKRDIKACRDFYLNNSCEICYLQLEDDDTAAGGNILLEGNFSIDNLPEH